MKLSQEIKRMLNALAYANAGENLNLRQKSAVLAKSAVVSAHEPTPAVTGASPQLGLYMGKDLPEEVMQYALQTCQRMKRGLTILSTQSGEETDVLLATYRKAIDEAGVKLCVLEVKGEPPASLAQVLRKHPEVSFVVCNGAGWLGRGLINGTLRRDALPVPVVLVAANETAELATPASTQQPRVA